MRDEAKGRRQEERIKGRMKKGRREKQKVKED